MNGCQYAQKKFSAPTSWKSSQMQWDMAFMSDTELKKKYNGTAAELVEHLRTHFVNKIGVWTKR